MLALAVAMMPVQLARAQSSAEDLFRSFPGVSPGRDFGSSGATMPERDRRLRRPQPEAAQPAKPLTPAEKAEAVARALAPRPPLAVVRKQTLDDLYAKLSAAQDGEEAKGLADLIGAVWMRTSSDTAALLMTRAVAAFEARNYPLSLQLLDQLVVLQPAWPEAWNKRATVRYFSEDLDGSMADVERVLKLEPRHFGALDGLGAILERTGLPRRALQAYRRALAVYPHQLEIEKIVAKLTLEVEGRGI